MRRITNSILEKKLENVRSLTGLEIGIDKTYGVKKLCVKCGSGYKLLNYKGFTAGEINDQLETLINVIVLMEKKKAI